MSPELAAFLKGAALALPAVIQPGPLLAFLFSRSSRYGARRTLPAAFAPLISDGPILLLVLLVLRQFPPLALTLLQGIGGGFLLYLAVGAFRAARRDVQLDDDPRAGRRSLRDGVLLNFLNPGPYLTWSLVAGPILLESWNQSRAAAGAFLLGFYGPFVGGLSLAILLFATAGQAGEKGARIANLVSGAALAGFGVWQILRAVGLD